MGRPTGEDVGRGAPANHMFYSENRMYDPGADDVHPCAQFRKRREIGQTTHFLEVPVLCSI